jgi:hypothetical protein
MAYPGQDAYGFDREDVLDVGSDRPPRRPWLTPVVLALAAIAAGVLVASHSGTGRHSGPSRPRPQAVSVRSVGHRLLGVHAGWEVFARGPDSMVAIDLAAGRITTTRVPALESDSPEVAFIVGEHDAIIRSFDQVPGYDVPDGEPARPLTGALAFGNDPGPLLPGPRPGQTWALRGNVVGFNSVLELIGPDGRPTGTSARLPPDGALAATAIPDGRGNALLLTSSNLTYDASATRYWQVKATVLAVGPAGWLGLACHGLECHNVVVSAVTGAVHLLPGSAVPEVPAFPWPSLGVTSPDGRYAAVPGDSGGMTPALQLVNLGTGASVPVSVRMSPRPGYEDMAWSPDSRWLFVSSWDGELMAVNAATGKASRLGVPLPPVTQVAIRAAPDSGRWCGPAERPAAPIPTCTHPAR